MRGISALLGLAFLAVALSAPATAADAVLLHAAGSLRAPLTEIAKAYGDRSGLRVEAVFGASGILLDRIIGGERAEVFASANMQHPLTLARAGRSGPVTMFARNRLCALVRPGLDVTTETVIERLLDPGVKLGTSTPKADPSGDYAWEVFRKVDALKPGSFALLAGKALQLTGGPASPPPQGDRSVYAAVIERGDADLFLTYCTNARQAAATVPGAHVVELPEPVAVGAEYGLTVLSSASTQAHDLVRFVLSPKGQAVLSRHGFTAPTLPIEGSKQ